MSNKKSRKIIKHKHKPRPSTHPKIKNNPSDSDSSKVSWRLSDTDRGGNWGCSLSILDDSKAKEIIRKLRDYDSMTWADLKGRNSHTIPTNKISKEAKDRLLEIEKDDVDLLFSIRISGKERLWGVREGSVFNILWWDPEHKVYPCKKKGS